MSDILKISQFINPTLGFFSHMDFDFEVMEKIQLDILFYANYGEKNPAPIVLKTMSLTPTELEVKNLAKMVEALYSSKWTRLKALSKLEYDPIHNYKDELTETINETGLNTRTQNSTTIDTRTDTLTRDLTRTDDLTNASQLASDIITTSDVVDGIFGFNSAEASDADKSVASSSDNETSNNTITNTGSVKNTGTESTAIDDTKTNEVLSESNLSNDRTRTSTHSGNIGNLTTQQLMKQEIELWKWNFIQNVLADLCEIVTLPIYLS